MPASAMRVAAIDETRRLLQRQSPIPEIRYRSVADFLKPPADLYLGEVAGVAVNSKGHLFVFSRGNTTGLAYGAAAAQPFKFGAGAMEAPFRSCFPSVRAISEHRGTA